jgi:hypothetical protein
LPGHLALPLDVPALQPGHLAKKPGKSQAIQLYSQIIRLHSPVFGFYRQIIGRCSPAIWLYSPTFQLYSQIVWLCRWIIQRPAKPPKNGRKWHFLASFEENA